MSLDLEPSSQSRNPTHSNYLTEGQDSNNEVYAGLDVPPSGEHPERV